jgi:hypothetical protein
MRNLKESKQNLEMGSNERSSFPPTRGILHLSLFCTVIKPHWRTSAVVISDYE